MNFIFRRIDYIYNKISEYRFSLILSLALFLSIGCSNEISKQPPKIDKVKELFDDTTKLVQKESYSCPSDYTVDLYLDTTMSMYGFIKEGSSNYLNKIGMLQNNLYVSGFKVNIFKFSDTIEEVDKNFIMKLNNKSIYGGDTFISNVLNIIKQGDDKKISIIISDLAQSYEMYDIYGLTSSLNSIVEKKPYVCLLAFRSSFFGKFYPETPPKKVFNVSLDGKERGRPFYFLIFAPSYDAFQCINTRVLSDLKEDQRFMPKQAPIDVTSVNLAPVNRRDLLNWYRWGGEWDLNFDSKNKYVSVAFATKKNSNTKDINLTFDVKSTVFLEIKDLKQLLFEIKYISYFNGKPKGKLSKIEPAKIIQGIEKYGDESNKMNFKINYKFPIPEKNSWDIYYIKIKSGEANIQYPRWLNEWSTNDDRIEENTTRTINLDLLVKLLINKITENEYLLHQLIFVGGNN